MINDPNNAMLPQDNILVTVVMPAYNAESCLERAILSVQAQTEQSFEIIVIDDASTDATATVVTRLSQSDRRIRLISQPQNGGPSIARNAGFSAARGRWIAVLDADDVYRPNRLATLIGKAESNSLDMIADEIVYFDEKAGVETGIGGIRIPSDFSVIDVEHFLERSLFRSHAFNLYGSEVLQYAMLKFVFRTDFIRNNSIAYSPNIRDGEDFYFYVECLLAGAKAAVHSDANYVYTQRIGAISRKSSDQTRTIVDRLQTATVIDELICNYSGRFSKRELHLLAERRSQAFGLQAFESALKQKRQHGILKALRTIIGNPLSWGFVSQAIIKRTREGL